MMPQTTKKVSPEYAKSFYGFVIDNTLPFSPQSRFIVEKKEGEYSQSTTITRNPDYEEPQEPQEQEPEPPQTNGDLF
jgi:hypothetical protein